MVDFFQAAEIGVDPYSPLSRNENELIGELRRNETEQSPLPIFTRLCRLQTKL
jgi:hypothetical protein